MKVVQFLLMIAVFVLNGCNGKDKPKEGGITSEKICELMDIKTISEVVGKKLHASPGKKKFDYARTCSFTNESGFPYITLTLYFNERGHELAYFAPPSSLFESEIKELPKEPNPAIAVISKKERNTIEILVYSNRRVVALTLFNVDAKDGSKNQKILIHEIQNIANRAKELK